MLAAFYARYGDPLEGLELQQRPEPRPGPGEVLLRVLASPFLHGSRLAIRGRYCSAVDLSCPPAEGRQGYEGVGIVEAVGEGVRAHRDLRVGQRVMFFYALGAWAEMVTASVEVVTAVPEELPDQIAPQLHVNPLTAILLFRRAQDAGVNKLAGKGLVLDAAGSTVGKMILEFASLAAVPVLGAVRRAEAAEKLQGRFPHARFLSTANASWSNALAAAAPSGGWFVALDAVSGAVGSALFDALAPGGRLVTYGDLSEEPLQVNALSFAMRSTRIESLVVSDWVGLTEAQRRREIEPAFELARSLPDLFPVATEVPLAEIRRAAALLECAGREGVVLLRP